MVEQIPARVAFREGTLHAAPRTDQQTPARCCPCMTEQYVHVVAYPSNQRPPKSERLPLQLIHGAVGRGNVQLCRGRRGRFHSVSILLSLVSWASHVREACRFANHARRSGRRQPPRRAEAGSTASASFGNSALARAASHVLGLLLHPERGSALGVCAQCALDRLVVECRGDKRTAQQAFGSHHDQRLPPKAPHLPA